MSGRSIAWVNSAAGPSNIQNVTNTPTARKAMSFTSDSAATASIRPSWCSVASIWRVPNSTAKAAIDSATNSAMSPTTGMLAAMSGRTSPMMVPSDADTALSWSAM